MALITLKEYAARHGKLLDIARQKANRGGFKTAVRMGRDWFIDEDEPYEDLRVKSGKFKDWRKKYSGRKNEDQQENDSPAAE